MPKEDGYITPEKRKDMAPRGKGKQTVILEAIKKEALLGLSEGSTREEAEKALFGFMAKTAFNPTEETASVSNMCLNLLMKKGWPDVKSTMPLVDFEFNPTDKPHDQASQVMKAAADGLIAPDIANMFISSIASMMKISEVTELEERIAQLEAVKDGEQ